MGIINAFVSTNSRPDHTNSSDYDFNMGHRTTLHITPLKQVLRNLVIKLTRKGTDIPYKHISDASAHPNVRCLECGWRYDFKKSSGCPICTSERTYLLSNGTLFSGILLPFLAIAAFCALTNYLYSVITG
jgi:hypothetical protein